MNMLFERKLPIPMEVKEMYPLSGDLSKIFDERDAEIKNIISGKSDKLLLIIGPCSADNEDSVIDYITRLRGIQEQVKDKIFIVPRIYTNK
ncbi:MAG: 3-deoxy-7-phosphoheptulonate synthase, partial [Firmicutes bacterium]|nr:3-deoxy-7-phosphoheptulonate synthase [Bacillota bacterium]